MTYDGANSPLLLWIRVRYIKISQPELCLLQYDTSVPYPTASSLGNRRNDRREVLIGRLTKRTMKIVPDSVPCITMVFFWVMYWWSYNTYMMMYMYIYMYEWRIDVWVKNRWMPEYFGLTSELIIAPCNWKFIDWSDWKHEQWFLFICG